MRLTECCGSAADTKELAEGVDLYVLMANSPPVRLPSRLLQVQLFEFEHLGKGNRMILANTEDLHNRIATLCARIRDLEDALRTFQESVSTHPHPLLREDLLGLKTQTPPRPNPSASPTLSCDQSSSSPRVSDEGSDARTSPEADGALVDAFGMLTIGPHGEANFLGQTARSEHLLRALSKSEAPLPIIPRRLSKRIVSLAFPDLEKMDLSLGREIYGHLPPLSEAIELCDMYVTHATYLNISLPRTELIDDVLETVYRAGAFENLHNPHNLSLLFAVFAIALVLDPVKNPWSIEARECYHLARAVLAIVSPLKETTLAAIQALLHLASYLELSDWEATGPNQGWLHVGMAVRLAYGIGLHLNSKRWKLCDSESKRRHRLFWQLFVQDTWISASLGRPPTVSVIHTDCPYPDDEVIGPDGVKEMSYLTWVSKYSLLMHDVIGASLPNKPYNAILALDRRVRDFYVPPSLRPVCGAPPPVDRGKHMIQLLCLIIKESTLLNLHRPYFTQALHDQPEDLATHRYIPSVMATYRSAWRLIRLASIWRDQGPAVSRIGCAWSPAVSAALVMCVLVIRAPSSKMTASALEELEVVSQLFQDAASNSRFAQCMNGAVMMLNHKAQAAVAKNPDIVPPQACIVTPADLDRLGGRTHLVTPTPAPPADFNDWRTEQVDPTDLSAEATSERSQMHPTSAQDMDSFDVGEPSQFYVSDVDMASAMAGTDYGLLPEFADFATTSPPLDVTWQSLVEELGF
ncbi:unnamed protein product [Mycena citricolor]|uniref:Xylanolytic transcriptional activator regulatory domain-containing protein n=1 Tax=Mycena citricolor TaxID=2018698 RepID=A0AAD2HVE9_9AGAR|nr:unnamed protein product [Mycena citricolor]CAK5280892.1 unnamed protein product [Mycena citricolor]